MKLKSNFKFSQKPFLTQKNLYMTENIDLINIYNFYFKLGYGLDDQGSRVRFWVGAGNFSLLHCIQNSYGTHPASYPIGTRGAFPGGKVTGV